MTDEELIEYFTVKYQAVGTTDDSIDDPDDIPDRVEINGWIIFDANLRKGRGLRFLTAQKPFELFPLQRRVRVVNGKLDHNGTGQVKLEAATGHAVPEDWNWQVKFDLMGPNGRIQIDPFAIPAVPGSVVDLTAVAPVGASTGSQIILGPYVSRVEFDDGIQDEVPPSFRFGMSNGTELPPVHADVLDNLVAGVQGFMGMVDEIVGHTETSAANAQEAAGYANTASTAAGVAGARAADAAGSAAAAEAARAAAVTAKTAAETARTGAETAKTAAETARTGAETAKTAAETARTTATTKATEAATSATNADTARAAAVTAKTQAEAARDQALQGNVNDGAVTTAKLAGLAVTTAKIADANVTLAKMAADSVDSSKIVNGSIVDADINSSAAIGFSKLAGIPFEMIIVHSGGTRKAGYGDLLVGEPVPRACTIDSVLYQFGTADASGNTVVELRKNNTVSNAIGGTSLTVSAANQTDATTTDGARTATASGPHNVFLQNDRLVVNVSGVGTTPGKVLKAIIRGRYT